MFVKIRKRYLIIVVVLLAIVLRFYQIGTNPPSLTWDEVSWGYNAYSLGVDGKDEFGRFLPYDYLESFGDFKPPAYAYLDILPIKIFGLNEFAVRFPSALLGSLTVLVTYFLVKRIFEKDEIALLSSFMLAVSPWHINLSRAAFEANVSTFFIVLGVWLFLEGVTKRKWFLILSILSFMITIYTFNSARVFVPLFVLSLIIGFRKELLQRKKEFLIACFVGFLFLLPISRFLLSPQAQLRFKEVNIFSDISIINKSNQEIKNDNNQLWSKVIHNRRVLYSLEFLHHYFDNLNPDFLFIKGDGNPKFSTQDVGELFAWEFPFVLLGLLFLFKNKTKNWWIIVPWFVLGIIPAGTARETPHALRIETIIPIFQILSAYGLLSFLTLVNKNTFVKKIAYFLIIFIGGFSFVYYLHGYYVHYPREFSGEWQYGYKESIVYVNSVKDTFDKVVIIDKLGRPYIYYLFYSKTPPDVFRNTAIIQRDVFGFVDVKKFDKYYFDKNTEKYKLPGQKILYIDVPPISLPNNNIIKRFYLLNGQEVLDAYVL